MKNIHILPTDKASRLCYDKDDNLLFAPNAGFTIADGKQNIYITSDEDPKNKDYYWDENKLKVKRYFESRESFPSLLHRFKVILTTDPTLIADGVQAIDNTFLEWFVKNPSCESVKIESWQTKGEWDLDYKIIIPKEEPKQHVEFINNNIEEFEGKLKEFKQEQKQYLIDMMRGDEELGLYNEPKQETIEEAAERLVNRPYGNVVSKSSFIEGAEYQAERMYSEEEVRKLLETQRGNCYVAILTKTKDKELAAIAGGAPEPSGYNGWVK
jgi:hypothetical protein